MRYPFLAGAAVVVMTAALAACGSSADGNGSKAAGARSPAASGPAATGPSAADPAAEPGSGPGAGPTSEAPKVPADRITPATGSFTEEQKGYLVNRVPRGMDPAAVLQTGQETCGRIGYLVKADRETAVGAIVTGEVPDAKPAIAHLCTQHRALVEEAARGYPDGVHSGKILRPGRYHSVSPTDSCSWQIAGADGKDLGSGTSGSGKRVEITLPKTARTFTSTGCYAWLPEGETG